MTPEENDLLCRVEGDAPMGQIMRRHWIAACLSEEVAEPDGAPLRVRLLGETLVVFRDSKGGLGVLDECAESIWPSKICAQLQRTRTLVEDTRASGVGANAGGSKSGISSADPM